MQWRCFKLRLEPSIGVENNGVGCVLCAAGWYTYFWLAYLPMIVSNLEHNGWLRCFCVIKYNCIRTSRCVDEPLEKRIDMSICDECS